MGAADGNDGGRVWRALRAARAFVASLFGRSGAKPPAAGSRAARRRRRRLTSWKKVVKR